MFNAPKQEHFEKDYECRYCKRKFTRVIRSVGEGHSKVTTQVNCPGCGNFLKTWDDAL